MIPFLSLKPQDVLVLQDDRCAFVCCNPAVVTKAEGTMSDHQRIDRQVAAMHGVIAARIRSGDLSPLARARANLQRWEQQFGGVLPPAYVEWVAILDSGLEGVLRVLEGGDEDAVRIRSSSPFAGVLSPRERWEILRRAA
jgi:hypothetical protein